MSRLISWGMLSAAISQDRHELEAARSRTSESALTALSAGALLDWALGGCSSAAVGESKGPLSTTINFARATTGLPWAT